MRHKILAVLVLVFGTLSLGGQAIRDSQTSGSQADPLRGKVINVIGDSYVENHLRPASEAWHSLVAQRHGMTYNNYGHNGICVAFERPDHRFGNPLTIRYRDMDPSADLVLIIAGHNDACFVGTSKDSLAVFAKTLDWLLDSIKVQCPKAKLAWVTPWRVDKPGFAPIVETIKKVCEAKGVPVLDNHSEGCIIKVQDPEFRSKYFQSPGDDAHLNVTGHELFYPIGEAFIQKVMEGQYNTEVKTLGVRDFIRGAKSDPKAVIPDVRKDSEFSEGHIERAVNIDWLDEEAFRKGVSKLSKDRTYYVYCRSGRRSLEAANKMGQEGFRVVNMEGGILEWTKQGLPLVK